MSGADMGRPSAGTGPRDPGAERAAGFRLRLMEKDDLPTVLAIERVVFPDDAWTEEMLAAEQAAQGDTHYYVVATEVPDKAERGRAPGSTEVPDKAERARAPGSTEVPDKAERARAPGSTEVPDKAERGRAPGSAEVPDKAERARAPGIAPDPSVVGYAGLFAPGGGQGDVQTIAVRADRQGRGIGTALLYALISEAAARDCREVFLDVRAGNAVARRLYRRVGFTDVGVRRGYYQPSGADAIVMRLQLDLHRDTSGGHGPGWHDGARHE